MFLVVITRPMKIAFEGKEYDFDGKVGVIPCTEECVTRRASKHGPAGARIQINKNVDSDFYHNLFAEVGGIFDLIEEKLPWLKGKERYIQQDGARPHTAEGTVEDLALAGSSDEWHPVIVTQPPNSPDLNLCDLGFFSSLKRQVSQTCTHCTDRDQMMQNVVKAFNDYPRDKLEDMWASYYNNMRSIMEELGGNDYKQAHNGGKKRKRDIGTSVDLSIDLIKRLR